MIIEGIYFQNWRRYGGTVAIVPIATGLLRYCQAYLPFGTKTQ